MKISERCATLEAENRELKDQIKDKDKQIYELKDEIKELCERSDELRTIKKSFEVLRALYLGDYEND